MRVTSSPFRVAVLTASFRRATEDRLAVFHIPDGLVVAVADGAGGIPGGGAAADLALNLVADAVHGGTFDKFASTPWRDLMVHLDALVATDREAGETTMSVVSLCNDGRVVGASVGDSGALHVGTDGTIEDLTERQHRKRRLGSGRAIPISFEGMLSGTLLVATDGLLAFARSSTIAEIVLANEILDDAAAALVDRVRLPSGSLQDDVALVLVRGPEAPYIGRP